MNDHINELGQAVGFPVPNWTPRALPPRTPIQGQYCRIEPLNAAHHAEDLFKANSQDAEGRIWTYLGYGPYDGLEEYKTWVAQVAKSDDPLFHAIIDLASGRAVGVASLMRIDSANGVIEVGHINYSPLLQRTPAATEAMYLLMRRVFDELGYRRYEWKCDALNTPSRRAAKRLGFTYEGLFRQAMIYKGRNRDTAWYSIVDSEWPRVKAAFENWLEPANFRADGQQQRRLHVCG